MGARTWSSCCCNSWRLYFMRRRATYAFGGHFIAPHKSMLFLSYLGVSGESIWSILGILRMRVDVLAALFDAQAAQIRVGVFFYSFVQKQAPYRLCAGCVHTRHRWIPGTAETAR